MKILLAAAELPIDRWLWPTTIGSEPDGVIETVLRGITTLLMQIAALGWVALRAVFDLAYMDFIAPMFDFIDAGFAAVFEAITGGTPIFGFVLVAGIAGIAVALFRRGPGSGLFHQILLFALPIAALLWLATSVTGPGGTTPATIAEKGVEFSHRVSSPDWLMEISNQVPATQQLVDATANSPGGGLPASSTPMSCGAYVSNLYKQSDASLSRQFVSRLWESSYLSAFYVAEFDDPYLGAQVGCRLLEGAAGVPTTTQALIHGQGADPSYYIQAADTAETKQAKLLVWAICHSRPNGEQWLLMQSTSCDFSEPAFHDAERSGWETFWDWTVFVLSPTATQPNPEIAENEKALAELSSEIESAYATAMEDHPGQADQINQEYAMYSAITGGGIGQSLLGGALAVVSSAAMVFSFGTLAVGAGMAGILMVVLMMVLPVTLLALAVEKTRPVGSRLLSLTFAAFFAKVIFTLALSLTTALTGFGQAALADLMDPGMGRSILMTAIPVAIIFMLRKLAKIAGFGNLATINGAMKATASIDSATVQGRQGRGFGGTTSPFGGRSGKGRGGGSGGRGGHTDDGSGGGRLSGLAGAAGERVSREGRAHASHAKDARRRAIVNSETVRTRVEEARRRTTERAQEPSETAVAQRKARVARDGEKRASQYLYRDGAAPIPKPAYSTSANEGGRAFNTEDPFHAINSLPSNLTARRVDTGGRLESEDHWHNRLDSYLTSLGMRDEDGNDTYSLAGSLTPKEKQRVLNGDTKPLEKLATQRLSPAMIREAEAAAGVEDRYSTAVQTTRKERAKGAVAHGAAKLDPRQFTEGFRRQANRGLRREEIIDQRTRERARKFNEQRGPRHQPTEPAAEEIRNRQKAAEAATKARKQQ